MSDHSIPSPPSRRHPCYLSPMMGPVQHMPLDRLSPFWRRAVWSIPYLRLKMQWMAPVVTERIIEIPFFWSRLKLPPGASILEFGCTDSPLALELASAGYQVTGVDLRPYGFEHPCLRSLQGNFMDMALPGDSFDLVSAISSVEHCGLAAYGAAPFPHGDRLAVEHFRRVLKPGGRLILTVPYGLEGQNPDQRVYDASTLQALLRGMDILEQAYYVASGPRQWLPVDPATLAPVDSHSNRYGRTQGVALVVARRGA
ncbi:MAG: class I SAM-dependent methyltransferase [Planctomycetes bacterium]|nr:class I SAM-dependent methyltransferase [Planctomycetota bacterium]